ncbi:MAG: hypothetical protein K1X48_10750 [Burkholderiaceae bacterium]|nr:hypothetical protein [Burkholderiaceae bacterium]
MDIQNRGFNSHKKVFILSSELGGPYTKKQRNKNVKQAVCAAFIFIFISLITLKLLGIYPFKKENNEYVNTLSHKPFSQPRYADFATAAASEDARFIANWIISSGDNHNLSFVILDKKNAQVFVFNPEGRLLGATAVLLGASKGDDSVPGIGQRPLAQVTPQERTTPAGRFLGEAGRNMAGEDVVWVDYEAAVSMHRVRTNQPKERRLERLNSPSIKDNRISFGCINMPVAFYENILRPQFQKRYGMIYVLPEEKPLKEVFVRAYDPFVQYKPLTAKPIHSSLPL